MTRKPDYVFTVWADGAIILSGRSGWLIPVELLHRRNQNFLGLSYPERITHRIKVYLKEPKK